MQGWQTRRRRRASGNAAPATPAVIDACAGRTAANDYYEGKLTDRGAHVIQTAVQAVRELEDGNAETRRAVTHVLRELCKVRSGTSDLSRHTPTVTEPVAGGLHQFLHKVVPAALGNLGHDVINSLLLSVAPSYSSRNARRILDSQPKRFS